MESRRIVTMYDEPLASYPDFNIVMRHPDDGHRLFYLRDGIFEVQSNSHERALSRVPTAESKKIPTSLCDLETKTKTKKTVARRRRLILMRKAEFR